MPLSDAEIWEEIALGNLEIDPPPDPNRVGPSSIDLLLQQDLLLLPERTAGVIVVPSLVDIMDLLNKHGKAFRLEEGTPFLMPQHQLVIGKTLERVKLSNGLSARIEGKSSLARLGLSVHVTAPTVHAGFNAPLYLEMYNIGPFDLALQRNMQIAQLIVERLGKPAVQGYSGKFQNQT